MRTKHFLLLPRHYHAGSEQHLKVAGQYAAWRNIHNLVRRHLATGTTDTAIIPDDYGGDLDVAPNGVVVFDVIPGRYLQQVYEYRNGQVT